jgi:hypothetical protein
VARISVRVLAAVFVPALLSGAWRAQDTAQTFTFNTDKPGATPAGFSLGAWRQPRAAPWSVRRADANGYLHHTGEPGAAGYTLAIAASPGRRDVEVAARLRLAGGGRAAGLVWRHQDDLNFYAAVLDLGRGQVALWRVSAGNRVVLEVEDDLELDVDAWHVLKIRHDDDEVRVYLGGIRVFSEEDRRGARQGVAGRAGVIAQGDADVWIDDLRIAPAARGK